jgi:acyl-CoA synthetase (AMP-forming)/AMP-acid ligase II
MVNWVVDFEIQVHEHGRKPAVVFEDETHTYTELNRQANRFANWLTSFDARRVCLYVPNTYEVYIAALGAMKAGATPAPINYMFGRDVIEYVLRDAEADLVLTSPDDAEVVADAAADAGVERIVTLGESGHGTTTLNEVLSSQSPRTETVPQRDDDLFGLMYTSGTTGRPKGVYKSHGAINAHVRAMRHVWKITSDQTWLCAGPLYHTSGFESSSLPVLASGGTVVLHSWDIERFLREVETYQADSAYIAGSMLLDMLEYDHPDRYDVSSLKQVFAGGAPMEQDDYDTVESMYDVRVSERLGMTEVGILLTYPVGRVGEFSPRDEVPIHVDGSCGTVMAQQSDIRVVDLSTDEVLDEGEGELQVRGDTMFTEYLNKPEKTAASWTDDGWYRSGDVVRIDDEGYVYHLRRADDMIVTGGENVYPRGIESVLNHHPKISESAVFPIPDDHWGERVCAAVVLRADAELTEEEVIDYCKSSGEIADFEAPKQVFFRDALPKTPTKSIRRPDLTDEYRDVPSPN